MSQEIEKYCVVDAGNTRIKVVDFENGDVSSQTFLAIDDREKIKSIISSRKGVTSILSSVLNEKERNWLIEMLQPNVILDSKTPLPIRLDKYQTPQTLGADRIANAVAANFYSIMSNSLVIDIGTCIKFDFIQNGSFIGGSISPGYEMRLKAMHEFTGALPLLTLEDKCELVGASTKYAMLSGVINGIHSEIEGFIDRYNQQYQPLTIFLTGGDLKRFDKELKNSIFADSYLTVKGLYLILKHNV